jgi:Ca2+-binding EF-hand superfamily protein
MICSHFFSQEEIARSFDLLDSDANGCLSPDELVLAIVQATGYDEAGARQFIAHFDANQDGYIDKAEFATMWTLMFG